MTPDELIDAHAHLQHPLFEEDREEVLRRAAEAGVSRIVCAGTRPEDWPRVLELARAHPKTMTPSFGLHPWYAREAPEDWLKSLADHLDAVPSGIGETGLDSAVGEDARQERAFRAQLRLARERGLSVSIHCVRRWERLLAILREDGIPPARPLLHAYGGSADMVATLSDLGAFFSFAGFQLEEDRPRLIRALRAVPPDRLLLETDSPDPRRHWEPAGLRRVLVRAAALLGEDEGRLAARTSENALRWLGEAA